jgi:hypothetical protein
VELAFKISMDREMTHSESDREVLTENAGYKEIFTHLRFSFALIIFRRLSFVTNSSVSSLKANLAGGSLIFKLIHSCLTTSSTVRVGSMRALTVTPDLVVTLFVGTKATGFDRLLLPVRPCRLDATAVSDRLAEVSMWMSIG